LDLALAVCRVNGIVPLDAGEQKAIPSLLEPELLMVEALGLRDKKLLVVLDTLRLLSKHGQPARSDS
jgi:hypothetical protein